MKKESGNLRKKKNLIKENEKKKKREDVCWEWEGVAYSVVCILPLNLCDIYCLIFARDQCVDL